MSPPNVAPPPDRPANLRSLEVGEEAWMVVETDRRPSGRATVEGYARVAIVDAPDGHLRIGYRVCLLRVSGVCLVGNSIDGLRRTELYACTDHEEHVAFGQLVRFYTRRDR
ncbi:MAG: hypothetical protein KF850_33145 [Labilithrix sp.]|nr:hypothetical protein [Labilithrix sp.]MBX3216926.1 hypothetical protein [Labilithrix sp.]